MVLKLLNANSSPITNAPMPPHRSFIPFSNIILVQSVLLSAYLNMNLVVHRYPVVVGKMLIKPLVCLAMPEDW